MAGGRSGRRRGRPGGRTGRGADADRLAHRRRDHHPVCEDIDGSVDRLAGLRRIGIRRDQLQAWAAVHHRDRLTTTPGGWCGHMSGTARRCWRPSSTPSAPAPSQLGTSSAFTSLTTLRDSLPVVSHETDHKGRSTQRRSQRITVLLPNRYRIFAITCPLAALRLNLNLPATSFLISNLAAMTPLTNRQ